MNNPTIDGVSRVTIEKSFDYIEGRHIPTIKVSLPPCGVDDSEAWDVRDALSEKILSLFEVDHAGDSDEKVTLRAHCKQCAEVVKTWPEWKQNCLGGAPAVERQEPDYYEKIGNAISDILGGRKLAAIAALRTMQAWESDPKPLMVTFSDHKKGLDAYLEQITALQSTIAQLQVRVDELESGRLAVWYGAMPESNGKTNWTAILHRKSDPIYEGCGITLDRSECPDRVRYEADRVRYLIGDLAEEPFILDYDSNAHSGYTALPAPVAASEIAQHLEAVIAMFTPLDRACNRTLVEARACLEATAALNEGRK